MAYVWSLARSYLTTHATPPTMIAVAERFAQAGNRNLAERCHTMAREELGGTTRWYCVISLPWDIQPSLWLPPYIRRLV